MGRGTQAPHVSKRDVLARGAAAATLIAAPAVVRAADNRWTVAIPVRDFAPGDGRPCSDALGAAFDAALDTGLPLVFGRGTWAVEAPLAIRHTARERRAFPTIIGAGLGATRLVGAGFQGPILTVEGGPAEPPPGTFFFFGGGIEGIEFSAESAGIGGLSVRGWWHGTLKGCVFRRLDGHGLQVVGSAIDANPDWSASILRVETCIFERLGGWGYLDDHPIGASGFTFDHCLFNLCGAGGAFVRSHECQFLGCSFAACGYLSEGQPAPVAEGVGLRIGDGRTTVGRNRVLVAEFDGNRDAHLVIDRAASCLVEDARFVHNDRNGAGRLSPPLAVQLGTGLPTSFVRSIRVVRPLFRVDHEGTAVGYRLAAPAGASQIAIDAESITYNPARPGRWTRQDGFPPLTELGSFGISILGESP